MTRCTWFTCKTINSICDIPLAGKYMNLLRFVAFIDLLCTFSRIESIFKFKLKCISHNSGFPKVTPHQSSDWEARRAGPVLTSPLCCLSIFYAPINVKPAGGGRGRQGIGRDFDIFPKVAVKFPTPGQKCEVKYTEIPHPRKWFVVTGTNNYYNIPTPGTAR